MDVLSGYLKKKQCSFKKILLKYNYFKIKYTKYNTFHHFLYSSTKLIFLKPEFIFYTNFVKNEFIFLTKR